MCLNEIGPAEWLVLAQAIAAAARAEQLQKAARSEALKAEAVQEAKRPPTVHTLADAFERFAV